MKIVWGVNKVIYGHTAKGAFTINGAFKRKLCVVLSHNSNCVIWLGGKITHTCDLYCIPM